MTGSRRVLRTGALVLALLAPLLPGPAGAELHLILEDEVDYERLHAKSGSLGFSLSNVVGLGGDLGRLAGGGAMISLEYTENAHLDPYTADALQFSLNLMERFHYVQVAYGRRWSTVPFPKTFLRPWVGVYLTANLIEDDRYDDPEQDDYEGVGPGLAAAAGLTMRISRSVAVEAAARGSATYVFGRLEDGELFAEDFATYGLYFRLQFIVSQ